MLGFRLPLAPSDAYWRLLVLTCAGRLGRFVSIELAAKYRDGFCGGILHIAAINVSSG